MVREVLGRHSKSVAMDNTELLAFSDYTMCTAQKEAEEKPFIQGTAEAHSDTQVQQR